MFFLLKYGAICYKIINGLYLGGLIKTMEKSIIEVDRVIFKDVNDTELDVINRIKSEKAKKKFIKRMIISAIVIIFVVVFHSFGMVLDNNSVEYVMEHKDMLWDTLLKNSIWIFAAFVVFNAISLFFTFIKRQLVVMTENYFILLEAVVSDKYLGSKLATEGANRKNKYVVFECDQGVCSKAIEAPKDRYNATKVGDRIVVLKEATVEGFKLSYIKEDEYRKYLDIESKKA